MTDVIASGLSAGTARGVRAVLSKAPSDALRCALVDRNVAQTTSPPMETTESSPFTPTSSPRPSTSSAAPTDG